MYRRLPFVPPRRAGGQFLRPVSGLTVGDSIRQLATFDYAVSELRSRLAGAVEYALPAGPAWPAAISTISTLPSRYFAFRFLLAPLKEVACKAGFAKSAICMQVRRST